MQGVRRGVGLEAAEAAKFEAVDEGKIVRQAGWLGVKHGVGLMGGMSMWHSSCAI